MTRPPLLRCLGTFVLGVVIGLLGSLTFRSVPPWGIVLACGAVLAASVFARAWAGTFALVALGIGWVIMVQVLSLEGPGGDIVIPAQSLSYVWVYGGPVLVLAALFAPRSWFRDEKPADR